MCVVLLMSAICTYSTTQVKDGKIDDDALKAMMLKDHGGDEKKAALVNEILGECQGINNPQRCELAFQLMDCLFKSHAKNAGKQQ